MVLPKKRSFQTTQGRLAAHEHEARALEERLADGGLSRQEEVNLQSRLQKLNTLIPADRHTIEQAGNSHRRF